MRKQNNNNSAKKGGKKSNTSTSTVVTVKVPAAQGKVSSNKQASITRRGKDEIVVTHREYLFSLNHVGDDDFSKTVQTVPINPGLRACFPWLSTIAPSYESYRFEKLNFIFETSTATSSIGAFIMAFDYDASDSPPTLKSDFLNFEGAVKGPVWSSDLVMKLDSKRLNKIGPSRYVRAGNRPGTDIKTYDVGNLSFALLNSGSLTNYGDLFVEYTVVLQTPQLNSVESISDKCATCTCTSFSGNATCFNGAVIAGGLPVSCTGSTFTFPYAGRYLVDASLSNVGTPALGLLGSTYANVLNIPDMFGASSGGISTKSWYIDVLKDGGYVLSNSTGLTAANNMKWLVTRFIV